MPRQHRQRVAARIGTVLGTQSPFSIFTFPILQICCCGCQSLSQDLTQQASASVACTASTWRWALEWATARKSSAHASAHGGKKRMAAAVAAVSRGTACRCVCVRTNFQFHRNPTERAELVTAVRRMKVRLSLVAPISRQHRYSSDRLFRSNPRGVRGRPPLARACAR